MTLQRDPRLISFYLPQYHPIPENDRWWGKGFTEWTNVARGRPLFRGHYQPHLPADLGFYDLRLPEAREAQAELAREYGLGGFCYYHYWFNGRRVLERPFQDVLASGRPDFPFCLCWANENWTRRWDGQEQEILLRQQYSPEDDVAHLRSLLPAFEDDRYIKIGDRPLFLVYRAGRLPEPRATTDRWRREAERAGFPGLFLARVESFLDETGDPRGLGFDAALEFQPRAADCDGIRILGRRWWQRRWLRTTEPAFRVNGVFRYDELARRSVTRPLPDYPLIRTLCPSWDNTCRRRGAGATILLDSTPAAYEAWLSALVRQARQTWRRTGLDRPTLFVNAWNEWAEGNHLEPCQRWGRAYLEATRRCLAASTEGAQGAEAEPIVHV